MKKNIVLLAGDGIGPDVTRAATTVLRETAQEFNHQFEFAEFPIGGAAIDVAGAPLPNATLDACRKADAVLLGAVGGPKWDALPVGKRPETGLLALRQGLGLYVNVRPVKLLEPLRGISPLKVDRLGDLDLEIVRELAGGMYFLARVETLSKMVWSAPSTPNPIPRQKLSASPALLTPERRVVRAVCARSTRPTCLPVHNSGAAPLLR